MPCRRKGEPSVFFFSHSLLKTNLEGRSWQVRCQEYPGSGEKDILHKQLELQRSPQCLFLCPKQPTSLSSELFQGTHIEAEAHGSSFNGWVWFFIHLWNTDLNFRVETPCGKYSILPQVICPGSQFIEFSLWHFQVSYILQLLSKHTRAVQVWRPLL